jgi:hypothetical protein
LLHELDRQFGEHGTTPFPDESNPSVDALSFGLKDIPDGKERDAWSRFLSSIECDDLGWPVHLGIAQRYREQGKLAHAAAVFERLHRHVRQEYDHIVEMSDYQAAYLPEMLQVCAERGDLERVRQIFGRVEELYEDGHLNLETYSDSLIEILPAKETEIGETAFSDRDSMLGSARRTIIELNDRLSMTTREYEALRISTITGTALVSAREKARLYLFEKYGSLMSVLYKETVMNLVEAQLWSSDPFKEHGPSWTLIAFQKAVECEFNEKVWTHASELKSFLPKELGFGHLTLNQISKFLFDERPLIMGLRRQIERRGPFHFPMELSFKREVWDLKNQCNRARHGGDRKPYKLIDLEDFLRRTRNANCVFVLLRLFQRE